MELAVWNASPAAFAISGFTSGAVRSPFTIRKMRPEECAAALVQDLVDVALVPASMALQGSSGFDVIPGVALSSWKYPFARLILKNGLRGGATAVAHDRRYVQERFLAQVVLQEHYGLEPAWSAYDAPTREELLGGSEDAALLTGEEAVQPSEPQSGVLEGGGLAMDLGQEWYELANYPMVWGLFVAKEDTVGAEVTEALLENVEAAESQRSVWVQAREMPAALGAFYRDDLRLRFDDLVTASLTELKHYLFYYDVLEDVPTLSFAPTPEDGEEGEKVGG